jgi:hypothetical protein
MTTYTPLRMLAKDGDDLAVMASCLQDALIPLSGMEYHKNERTFHLIANRFCWECPPEALEDTSYYMRVQVGLSFHHVTDVKQKDLDLKNQSELVNLLTIHDGEESHIHLIFSGGAEIRLTVDQIHCQLTDMDEPYHTTNKPSHENYASVRS